jgi:hypothetical protein
MALYKEKKFLVESSHTAFDSTHNPGVAAPDAGIYRCTKCGHEIGIAQGHTLPSQVHAKHPPSLGDIKWQLIVFAQHNQAS